MRAVDQFGPRPSGIRARHFPLRHSRSDIALRESMCCSRMQEAVVVGQSFIQHGHANLARRPEDFINVLHAMGVPTPLLPGWAC